MTSLLLFGMVMGLLYAVRPGVITAETFRRGVARGFPAALNVQLGSLVGDAAYCVLALAGVTLIVQNVFMQWTLGIISVGFLAYLAVTGIITELTGSSTTATQDPRALERNAFFAGIVLSLTNPFAIGFWLSLGGTLATYGALESLDRMVVFFCSFYTTVVLYSLFLAFAVGYTRRVLSPRTSRWLSLGCSLMLVVLAGALAVQMLGDMLHSA